MWFKVIFPILFVSMIFAENSLNHIDLIPTLNTSAMANLEGPDDWVLFSYGPKGHKIREESIIRHEKISDVDPFTVIVGFIVENHENKYIVRSYAGSEQGIQQVGMKKVDSTIDLNAEDLAEEFSFIKDESKEDDEDKDKDENEDKDEDEDEDEDDHERLASANQGPVYVHKEPEISNKPMVMENIPPMIQNTEPVVENPAPIVDKIEPVAEKLDPIVNHEPAVENNEPIARNMEPIVENIEHVENIQPMIENLESIVENHDIVN